MASNTPLRSSSTPISNSNFKSKSVFLHEWWLVKPLNHCNGFAVSGITSMGRGERVFVSSLIVKRHETNVVETQDGIIVGFSGFINFSRSFHNGFSSQLCQRFSIGFPHDWKKLSARLENESDYDFDVSNTPCHKETTHDTSQEPIELEGDKCLQETQGNDDIATHNLSHPQVEVAYNAESKVSDFDDLNASFTKKTADVTSHEAKEAEDDGNVGSLRMSQLQVDVINTGEKGVSTVAAADVKSPEAKEVEDDDNVGSLRMSQLQVDMINTGENGVSSVAAADVKSQEAKEVEDDDNVGSLRMSQLQVDMINTGENGVSSVAAADVKSQEAKEVEDDDNVGSLRMSQLQVDMINTGENGVSSVAAADVKSQEAKEVEDDDNVGSLRMSQLQVDMINTGENGVSSVAAADVKSQEAKEVEDDDNVGSLRMSQLQVVVINAGENGVSSVAAAESNQSKMGVFEFDPVMEQSSVKSPLHPKKLKLSSDSKENNKHLKQKMVEDPDNSCRRVTRNSGRRVTRSIAKKRRIML